MNKLSTSFTVKLLAAFASFGAFMLVLVCAVGLILPSDAAPGVEDSFLYSQLRLWQQWSPYLMFPAVLALIFLLVWLVRTTGLTAEENQFRLAFIDRIDSDIFTGGVLILAILYFYLFADFWRYNFNLPDFANDVPVLLVLGSLICLPVYFLGLIWFLSISRRIRAGVLWRNSLIARICRGLWRLVRRLAARLANLRGNGSLVLLTVLIFSVFLIADGILANFWWDSFQGFLLAVAFNLTVLVFLCNTVVNFNKISRAAAEIADGNLAAKINIGSLSGRLRQHAAVINNIGNGLNAAVAERMKSENFKTELIANVSHDLKTPLTSIVNYVDLLKKQPDPAQAAEYLDVLERNTQRLRELTDDLLDFSKFSTGNVQLQLEKLDLSELIRQGVGEYLEKLASRNLQVVLGLPAEPAVVLADGRQVWRILENILSNVRKYAQADTRVYVDLFRRGNDLVWTTKNISANPLNVPAETLMERFVRGDASRHTEGSGLGLSIAKSLAELQQGRFDIVIDGDLFKTVIALPAAM